MDAQYKDIVISRDFLFEENKIAPCNLACHGVDTNNDIGLTLGVKQNADLDQPRQNEHRSIQNDNDLFEYIPNVAFRSLKNSAANIHGKHS